MTAGARRDKLRTVLAGAACVRPASVHDAVSMRIAARLGYELGMLGGSTAALAVLGDPDLVLITLTELAEQVRRMSRAASLPVLVDADHGYGNALNVRRTVQELEAAGAAGLTIEDTLLPQAYGEAKTQLVSVAEGVGKMKAALDGRGERNLVIIGRTGAAVVAGVDEAIARGRAYEAVGVDALFFTGLKTRQDLQTVAAATRLPLILGNTTGELDDAAFLASQRVRIANQGHAPFQAAVQAIYDTMKALREGTPPKALKVVASGALMGEVSEEAAHAARAADWLGLKT
ncbi:MAG: isocitrate lyase/PEP mutase family protein [Xanthobacteraceae bacterium]|nr:MAG: isocitrate lyase/PEP mutase family protein [Xanthobacteraceae bacterium]